MADLRTVKLDDGTDCEGIFDPTSGYTRVLNLQPSPKARMMSIPKGREVLPMSEIRDFDVSPVDIKIKDQNGKGACNGHACATSAELKRAVMGMPYVPLSPWFTYAILCGGWDRGSNISDALDLSSTKGIAPESLVTYGNINPRNLSQQAYDAATRFKIEIGEMLTSWEEILSAIACYEPLNISIRVGNSFNSLDSEGVPPVSRGAGNHAVCGAFGIKTSPKWGKLIKIRNSWGAKWGLDGCFYMSEAHWENQAYAECYTVRAITSDPTDPVPDAA